jgi:hypothetical protein
MLLKSSIVPRAEKGPWMTWYIANPEGCSTGNIGLNASDAFALISGRLSLLASRSFKKGFAQHMQTATLYGLSLRSEKRQMASSRVQGSRDAPVVPSGRKYAEQKDCDPAHQMEILNWEGQKVFF